MSNIEKDGIVQEALPNAVFKVILGENLVVRAYISGRMHRNHIKILPGDKVKVDFTNNYDLTQARIVHRYKTNS